MRDERKNPNGSMMIPVFYYYYLLPKGTNPFKIKVGIGSPLTFSPHPHSLFFFPVNAGVHCETYIF